MTRIGQNTDADLKVKCSRIKCYIKSHVSNHEGN